MHRHADARFYPLLDLHEVTLRILALMLDRIQDAGINSPELLLEQPQCRKNRKLFRQSNRAPRVHARR